jgi:hypothetical protein
LPLEDVTLSLEIGKRRADEEADSGAWHSIVQRLGSEYVWSSHETSSIQSDYLSIGWSISQSARCGKRGDHRSRSSSKITGALENARQDFFGIFRRTARLFQNFLAQKVSWFQKKRQNLFRKAAKLFRNLHVVVSVEA